MAKYYVDNSRPDGNGSTDRPWNNIAAHINDLNPGDTLTVIGDASGVRTYTETLRVTAHGTPNRRITVRAAEGTNVRFTRTSQTFLLRQAGKHWDWHGIEFDGNDQWIYTVTVDASGCRFYDCTFHNDRVHGVVVNDDVTDTLFEGCEFYDFGPSGVGDNDAHGVMVQSRCHRTQFRHCAFHDCTGDGIQFHDHQWSSPDDNPEDCVVRACTFYRGDMHDEAENGIDIKSATRLVIADCTFDGYDEEMALNIHQSSIDIEVGGCKVTNSRYGVHLHLDHDSRPDGVNVHHCVFDGCPRGAFIAGVNDISILNNTFVGCSDYAVRAAAVGTVGWRGGRFHNNLVFQSGRSYVSSGVEFTARKGHNGWFQADADSDLRASSDLSGDDPGFADADQRNYRLTSDSPCINAGVVVDLPYSGEAPDLGAHEYESDSTTDKIARCIEELTAIASQLETCLSRINSCVSELETCL